MKYYSEYGYGVLTDIDSDREAEVLFDDSTSKNISNTFELIIYDEDGNKYINIEKAENNQCDYMALAISGIDSIIRCEMEDNGKDYDAWDNAIDVLQKEYANTIPYPYICYDDFMNALIAEMGELSVRQLEEDMNEPDYEED